MSTPPAPPAPGDLGEAPHEPARHGRVGPTPPDGADQGENTAGPAGAGEPSPSGEPSPYVVHGISRALLVDDRERPRALAAGELRRVLPHVKLEVASSRDEAVHLLDRFAAKTASSQDDEGQGDQGQGDQATDGSSLPFLFAVLRDGMAWGEGMALPHVIRDRLPDVPLILTCDPEWDEAPADAQDPARAGRVVRREGLEEAIPIVGDNVAAIAAAAEACLKLDRLTAEQRQLRIERDRLAAERDRAAEERRAVEKKVDSLLRASVKSNEAEAGDRRRLALVLHEDMLQLLVAARMFLACAQDPAQPEPEGGPLGEIDSLLVRSVQLCKDLTGLWSPLVLYEAGLVAALRWLGDTTGAAPADGPADDAASDTGLDEAAGPAGPIPGSLAVEVDCDDDAEPGTQDGRTMLYQAAVELLTNVARHAGVDQARLTLRRVRPGPGLPDLLNLTVSDAGRGFDAAPEPTDATADAPAPPIGAPPIDAPPIDAPSGGAKAARVEVGGATLAANAASDRFGLFSLAERLRLAGGRMEVESVAGQGTTVRLVCPADVGRFAQRPLFADSDAPSTEMPSPADPSSAEPSAADPPQAAAPSIRVLLADDHRIIRMSLSGLLGRAAGVEVVGEAVDGEDAVQKACKLRPDVVLMDVNMPKLNGVEATRRLKVERPGIRVIALSMHESDHRELDMFEAGAECYVVKDGPPEQLLRAVRGEAAP